jgi:hypothetical protein
MPENEKKGAAQLGTLKIPAPTPYASPTHNGRHEIPASILIGLLAGRKVRPLTDLRLTEEI